jgi:GH35 family endo-1,4-beta-xylanase
MYRSKPERYRHYFQRLFDYATVTFYTHSTGIEDFEPVEGTYEFASRDLFVHHLERMGMEIEGRPLVWLHSMVAPEWQAAKDYDALLAYLRSLIPALAGRYRGRIGHWEIANEFHDWADVVHLDHKQIIEVVKLASRLTAEAAPGAERVVSAHDPFGVYARTGAREDGSRVGERQWTPYRYFRDLIAAGAEFEQIGIQIYVPYRDLTDMVAMLERIESLGKPVVVTEMGVPARAGGTEIDHRWTRRRQAAWAERMYTLLMSRPGIAGVLWYDFIDHWPFLPGGGLLDWACHPKPVYERIERLFVDAGRVPEAPPPRHRAGAGLV